MDTSWWRSQNELDDEQRAFILLPAVGQYMLEGPPGSGKTNLLLLRAQFIAGKGDKNVLVVSFTNSLADFMRTGVEGKGLIGGDQVRTFHSWASEHIRQYLDVKLVPKGARFDDETRKRALALLREANTKIPAPKLYDGIFVDEAQDFSADELECLLVLSDKVCVCGDVRQGIYSQDGLTIGDRMGLERYRLTRHYRIGQRIAQVADRLLPPSNGEPTLEASANYNPKIQGESTAKIHPCVDRDEQFQTMCALIDVQLVAFKGDTIGVFAGRWDTAVEVFQRLQGSKFQDLICLHGSEGASFGNGKLIHVMTMHASKGTEFRAVHLFGVEELRFPLNSRRLAFTAVTRAKTALNAYRTGQTNAPLEAAFAEPTHIDLDDLFPDKT